ncbi:MAG: phytanoyl-CoA dioxygenase family protein [Myxococcota bacterium]|nr:phytanoyl-CoA dioxygenase family protein [Myxococcota bacterium]
MSGDERTARDASDEVTASDAGYEVTASDASSSTHASEPARTRRRPRVRGKARVPDTIATPTRYPSRLPAGMAELFLPRDVPVVWSDESSRDDGALDPAALAHFDEHGFVSLPSFFGSDEVRALQTELDAQLAWAAAHPDDPRLVREPDADALRSIFAVHQTSARFEALSRDPRLIAIARQLLDDDVYLHQTRLNLKPGFDGKEFWWHSDFETWHHEDGMPTMRCFSCVIALSDVTPHNGPVLFLPGSHRTFVGCVGETPDENHQTSLRRQTIGVPSREAITALSEKHGLVGPTGPAGTVVLFDCNLLHASNGNVTPDPRHHLFFVYSAMDNRVVDPPSGRRPRPTYVATREPRVLRPNAETSLDRANPSSHTTDPSPRSTPRSTPPSTDRASRPS